LYEATAKIYNIYYKILFYMRIKFYFII